MHIFDTFELYVYTYHWLKKRTCLDIDAIIRK